jgi:hypothetical protein
MAICIDRLMDGAKKPVEVVRRTVHDVLYGTDRQDPSAKFRWPETIRFKVKNDEDLNIKDLKILGQYGFFDHAFYLAMKALDPQPKEQLRLLTEVSRTRSLREVVTNEIDIVPEGIEVSSRKLASIGPIGAEAVRNRFEEFAQKAVSERKSPVLVAYGGLIGFDRVVTVCSENNTDLYIAKVVSPDDKVTQVFGFKIEPHGEVSYLNRDSERPNKVVLLDDAIKTGKRIGMVSDFWRGEKASSRGPLENMCAFIKN